MGVAGLRRALLPLLLAALAGPLAPFAPARAEDEAPPKVEPAGHEPKLLVGGLLQTQLEAGDAGDSRFGSNRSRIYLRRARANLSGHFPEGYDFRLEMELAGTLAETSGLRGQLTDAWIAWARHPAFTIRGGQFKTPYGFEQMYAEPRWLTIERSLPTDLLTPGRQMGAMIQGRSGMNRVNYFLGLFNGAGPNTSANDNRDFLYVGRVGTALWQNHTGHRRIQLGVDGYASHDAAVTGMAPEFGFDSTPGGSVDNVFKGKRRGYGVDMQLSWDRLELWAEYLAAHFESTNRAAGTREAAGFSVQGAVMLVPERLQGVVRFEAFHPYRDFSVLRTDNFVLGLTDRIQGDDIKLGINWIHSHRDVEPDFQAPSAYRNDDRLLVRMQVAY